MEKEIIQIQLGYFFKNIYSGNFEEFSLKLKNTLSIPNTTILPIPSDASNELPRLILSSENFTINIAKSRLDIFAKDMKDINTVVTSISDNLLNGLGIEINRIGFVKRYFISSSIDSIKKILNESFQSLSLKEINININRESVINGYNCNNIENISSGTLKDQSGILKGGLVILRDINTVPNDNIFDYLKRTELINVFEIESNIFKLITDIWKK